MATKKEKTIKSEFYFIDNRIAIENIGEHDADNRFLMESIYNQMDEWRAQHDNECTPIGVCYDETMEKDGFYPIVFEDRDGNRFYTHIDIATIKEYIEMEESEAENA